MSEKPTAEKPTAEREEIADLAFEIYSKRAAAGIREGCEAKAALDALRKAEAFVATKRAYVAGKLETKKPDGPQLADCFCPNLKRTHPHNMVSQEWGSLDRVAKVNEWLLKNPDPTGDKLDAEKAFVDRFNGEFNLGWDRQAINIARNIFPAYVKN